MARPDVRRRALAAVEGRVVVVTGASSGIGRATALALAPAAARVVCIARRADLLEQLAAEMEGTADVRPLDLRDTAAATELGRALTDADVLIANAGHSIRRGILDYAERFDTVARTAGVNYLGAVALALPVVAAMAARGSGHLIGVTTVNATIPAPGWSAYCASKAAFDSWLRCAGPELGPHGVATTLVRFPLVATPMVRPVEGRPARRGLGIDAAVGWMLRAVADRPGLVAPWWLRPADALAGLAPVAAARAVGGFSLRR